MDGGAWNSGVFETGRDGQKARAPPAQGRAAAMEAGTTPAMYNTTLMDAGKDSRMIGVVTVTLRSLLIVFTLIALGLMVASKQKIGDTGVSATDDEYGSATLSGNIKFTDYHAFVGLLSVATIVFVYSVVQLVLCVVQVLSTGTFITSATSGGSLLTFIFDSVLAYVLIGAAGAAADSQSILKDNGFCRGLPKFCSKTQGSIAFAFMAFFMLATCAAMFPLRLYKMRQSK